MTAQHTKHAKHTKRKRRRRSPLRILIILILVIAVLVGLTLSTVHKKLGKISTKSLDHSQLVTVNKDSNMTDYTNYAFFGIDSQTGSMSDRGNRSDSIIVVSINNSTKDVKLLSIYRDTYVSINGKYSKINAAYSWGGPELAISTINRNLDLNIEKYATVNFKILADIVDAIGGIEVKVDKSILKNLNAYIGDMNRINGGHSPKLSSAGTYTLDGNQAVAYSRIRYTAGGDLARAGRQREVLQKIYLIFLQNSKSFPAVGSGMDIFYSKAFPGNGVFQKIRNRYFIVTQQYLEHITSCNLKILFGNEQ